MAIKNIIRSALRTLHSALTALARRWRGASPPPPEQLDLGLDQLTDTGLPLRDAIPVRSAEYWLQMGEPDLALKELQTLPESAQRHAWPLRVRLNALNTTTN